MAKQQPSPQQSERFVALQAALRQHFFAPSLNNLGNRIDVSTKTNSRATKKKDTMPESERSISSVTNSFTTTRSAKRCSAHSRNSSIKPKCSMMRGKSTATKPYTPSANGSPHCLPASFPENFPTEQHEKLNGLLQTRSSAFPWISLVLAHFFHQRHRYIRSKPNEITVVLEALKNLDEHLAHHYPRRYGRNIFPQIELQLPTRNKNELSFQYYVQLAELMIGEYSNPDAERSPRMGSHLLLGTVSFWHKVGEAPADGHSLWVIREPTRTADGVLAPKAYSITEFVLESTTLRPVRHARISFNAGQGAIDLHTL